jgi:acetylornithine deacetylase/succinyl-diaminopimelate desuccinylase-like protein
MNQALFLKQLKKLVEIPSFGGDIDSNKKIIDYVESIIPTKAKKIRWQHNGVETLIAGNNNLFTPDIAFIAHADVVSGTPSQFKLIRKGNKLIGRGVSDMKFAIPIGVSLLNKVITNKLSFNFTLVITTDEEMGGMNGVGYLVSQKKFKPKTVIVPDWGDNFVFTNRSKGVAMIQVESFGKTSHASEIWNGKDANRALCELTVKLLKKYGDNNKNKTWKTTMNIGVFQGGAASNQVCDKSLMKLDFRFPETRTSNEILSEVKDLVKKMDAKFKISLMVSGPPTKTNLSNPTVKLFISEFNKILNRKITDDGGTGATDARYFAEQHIPLLVIKPNGGDVHGPSEWIDIPSCLKYNQALEHFIDKFIIDNKFL